MKPTLVIFDFDGTLGDTRHNIVVTLQRTMSLLGLPLRSESECASTIGLTLEDSFRTMFPEIDELKVKECVATYREIFYQSIEELTPNLFEGVSDTLARLHAMDIKMSIASSRSSPSLLLFLRNMAIAYYFGVVLGSDNVTKHKPDPEPVLKIVAEYGVSPSEVLVVGDMPVDVLMAHNAGVRCVAVSYGNATAEELAAVEADYIIDRFALLADIIEGM